MRAIGLLVDELVAALVAFEPAVWSGADCADLAEVLARASLACDAASMRAARRAVECGAYRTRPDASVPEWLARVSGASAGATRAKLDTVGHLDSCPETAAALAAGLVSLEQAAHIIALPEHEPELLALARKSGSRAVRDLSRKRRVEGMDPDELHAKQQAARSFSHWKDELGMVCFRGALAPDTGVQFVNRLDVESDRVWRRVPKEPRTEARAAYAADAFVGMFARGGTGNAGSADVVFVIDSRAYLRGHAAPDEICHIIDGGPVPVSAVRERVHDAFVKAVLHNGIDIQHVAHHGRRRSARFNTALMLGDPPEFNGISCTEEGCDRRYHLQWDHHDPHANGGLTSKENLKPLCGPHHTDKTERDRRAGLTTHNTQQPGPAP